jgi:hypothetical protein
MTVVYNTILSVDDTLGPLIHINYIQCSRCTQLQNRNQKKVGKRKLIHCKRADRGRQSNHFDLLK